MEAVMALQHEVHLKFLLRDVEQFGPDPWPTPRLIVLFVHAFGEYRGQRDHLAPGIFRNLFHREASVVELRSCKQAQPATEQFVERV
jgi:hypothetical protein